MLSGVLKVSSARVTDHIGVDAAVLSLNRMLGAGRQDGETIKRRPTQDLAENSRSRCAGLRF